MPSLPNIQKTSYFHVFFEKDHLHFPSVENASYFREKGMPSFLMIKAKIIFQSNFFGKTIFSEHLEKENIVFRAVDLYAYLVL